MALPSYASAGLYSPPSSSTLNKEFSDYQLPESPYDMLTRLFWIGVSLLESDYEHEFLLAIKLIDKVRRAFRFNGELLYFILNLSISSKTNTRKDLKWLSYLSEMKLYTNNCTKVFSHLFSHF